jgi:hypothetical protein
MKIRYLAVTLTLISTSALADTRIGAVVQPEFTGATGTRTITSAAVEELHFNRDVFTDETVKTPHAGSTVIKFPDSTQIQVGHNSTVVLDKFVYDPQSSVVNASIAFSTGVFRFISGTAIDRGVVLTTPTTTLAIRGTKILINVGADGSSDVGVIDGSVDVTPCGGHDKVTLTHGQAVRVSAACNGADHISLAEVPVDPAVAGDFDSSSTSRNGSYSGSNQGSPTSKGGTEGVGPKASQDPDHDGDVDKPGEN